MKAYTKKVVEVHSHKNKGSVLDFHAWTSAQNGESHTAINRWLETVSKHFDNRAYDTEVSDSDDTDASWRIFPKGFRVTNLKQTRPLSDSKKKE